MRISVTCRSKDSKKCKADMFWFPRKGIQCHDTYAGPRTCCVHAQIRWSANFADKKTAPILPHTFRPPCSGFCSSANSTPMPWLHWPGPSPALGKKHVMDATRNHFLKQSAKQNNSSPSPIWSKHTIFTNPTGLFNAPKFLRSTEPSPGPWSFAVEFPFRESS